MSRKAECRHIFLRTCLATFRFCAYSVAIFSIALRHTFEITSCTPSLILGGKKVGSLWCGHVLPSRPSSNPTVGNKFRIMAIQTSACSLLSEPGRAIQFVTTSVTSFAISTLNTPGVPGGVFRPEGHLSSLAICERVLEQLWLYSYKMPDNFSKAPILEISSQLTGAGGQMR